MRVVRSRVVAGIALQLVASGPVFAQAPRASQAGAASARAPSSDCPEGDPTACGRRHFEIGTKAFEQRDFAAAAKAFQLALSERAHPVIRFNLALSLARLGRPTAALTELNLVIGDPGADKDLRARAEREKRSAEQAVTRVTFRLADPARDRVELDGQPAPLASDGQLQVDPGAHQVRVFSGASIIFDQELELSPGERVELRVGERSRRIDVVIVPDSAPAPEPHLAPKSRPAPDSGAAPTWPAARSGLSPVWFYAGSGATLALTGLTIWSGLDTKSAYSDYQRALPRLTQAEAESQVEQGHSRERRTNWLLGGSLLCAAGTAVLGVWLVDWGHGSAQVGFTPSSVSVAGRF